MWITTLPMLEMVPQNAKEEIKNFKENLTSEGLLQIRIITGLLNLSCVKASGLNLLAKHS